MNTEYVRMMTSAPNAAYETLRQWVEVNTRVFNQLVEHQMTMFETVVDKGFGAARRAIQAKDFGDLIAAQAETAQEMANIAVDQARKTMQLLSESREALTELLRTGVEQAAGEFEKTEATKAA